MITWEYATIFLLCSSFLLDFSYPNLLRSRHHFKTKRGVMPVKTYFQGRARLRHGTPRVQRIKRGWVWNQFFVLEEYMGSVPQYVGKLHTDMDHGDHAVKYTLSGEGVGSIFTIDQMTGDIHALRKLDREEKSYYILRAQAVDVSTGLPLEPESEFVVKVQDINDNEPRFSDGTYCAIVPEMSPKGTFVIQVTATDADDPTYGNSAQIVYSILYGQQDFSVDTKSGVIRTVSANMDREVKDEYQIIIQAKDMGGQLGGLASTVTINITLGDVNDNPPRFVKSIFHLLVPETALVDSVVGRILAHDLDTDRNAEVDYSIVPGDEGIMFDIISSGQSKEGVVVLKKPLDYETKKSYTFKVQAVNAQMDPRFLHLGPFLDSATVKVTVMDMEEPPVFSKASYSLDAYEDTPLGTIIGSVTAHDLDASSSAVRYSLEWQKDEDSCFDIDAINGSVSINEYLDREEAFQHNITVVAFKVINPVLSTKVLVTINVLDVNEFPPELAFPSDTFVCETSHVGQVIQMLSAVDMDLPPVNQRFFFKIPKELRNRNFTVRDYGNNTAGIVTRHAGFQRGVQDTYVLPVVVEDSGYPVRSSTATVTIKVCMCGVEGLLLTCPADAITLPLGLSTGAAMAFLLCVSLLIAIPGLYIARRRHQLKDAVRTSKEDIRDNVFHYDDEGGGEEDTDAFDIGTLRNTHSAHVSSLKLITKKDKNSYGDGVLLHLSDRYDDIRSPDIHRQTAGFISPLKSQLLVPCCRVTQSDGGIIQDFIGHRLGESLESYVASPCDSRASEGAGSVADSLNSIEKLWAFDDLGDLSSLGDLVEPFESLASIFGRQAPTVPEES
ncbi:cadherin-12-like [Dunckerocampus dactyliophorus]|uniref:cadherin-12-like n=1 Tax=Dunckerocampus dactyliophorus TaxID=161453 RepID=UPI0024052FB8|nr:cadherin-12-like [Dunckerocampus dactyliophorus]